MPPVSTPRSPPRRRLLALAMALPLSLALAGCGTLKSISVDLAAFGGWPAGRAVGTYTVDRLPSQQAAGEAQIPIEGAARMAMEQLGFKPVNEVAGADVLLRIGARRARVLEPWAQFGVFGGRGSWGMGAGWGWPVRGPWGPGFGPYWMQDPTYDQSEVALVLVDRASQKVLYEAHVRYDSRGGNSDALLPTMFAAALQGFPALQAGERRVTVPVLGLPR